MNKKTTISVSMLCLILACYFTIIPQFVQAIASFDGVNQINVWATNSTAIDTCQTLYSDVANTSIINTCTSNFASYCISVQGVNINITRGGSTNLTSFLLEGCEMRFNGSTDFISDGNLSIFKSNMTSAKHTPCSYTNKAHILINAGSNFTVRNSFIEWMGYDGSHVGLRINAEFTTMDNTTLRGTLSNDFNANNMNFTNMIVKDGDGISPFSSARRNFTFINITVLNIMTPACTATFRGVSCTGARNCTIKGVYAYNFTLNDPYSCAVAASGEKNSVSDVLIENTGTTGVCLGSGAGTGNAWTANNITVRNNSGNGIVILGGTNGTLSNFSILNTTGTLSDALSFYPLFSGSSSNTLVTNGVIIGTTGTLIRIQNIPFSGIFFRNMIVSNASQCVGVNFTDSPDTTMYNVTYINTTESCVGTCYIKKLFNIMIKLNTSTGTLITNNLTKIFSAQNQLNFTYSSNSTGWIAPFIAYGSINDSGSTLNYAPYTLDFIELLNRNVTLSFTNFDKVGASHDYAMISESVTSVNYINPTPINNTGTLLPSVTINVSTGISLTDSCVLELTNETTTQNLTMIMQPSAYLATDAAYVVINQKGNESMKFRAWCNSTDGVSAYSSYLYRVKLVYKPYQQLGFFTTLANNTAYATMNITINNSKWLVAQQNISYDVLLLSGWTCNEVNDTLSAAAGEYREQSYVVNCTRTNVITKINTTNMLLDYFTVIVDLNMTAKETFFFNNTDLYIMFANIAGNTTSYDYFKGADTWDNTSIEDFVFSLSATQNISFNVSYQKVLVYSDNNISCTTVNGTTYWHWTCTSNVTVVEPNITQQLPVEFIFPVNNLTNWTHRDAGLTTISVDLSSVNISLLDNTNFVYIFVGTNHTIGGSLAQGSHSFQLDYFIPLNWTPTIIINPPTTGGGGGGGTPPNATFEILPKYLNAFVQAGQEGLISSPLENFTFQIKNTGSNPILIRVDIYATTPGTETWLSVQKLPLTYGSYSTLLINPAEISTISLYSHIPTEVANAGDYQYTVAFTDITTGAVVTSDVVLSMSVLSSLTNAFATFWNKLAYPLTLSTSATSIAITGASILIPSALNFTFPLGIIIIPLFGYLGFRISRRFLKPTGKGAGLKNYLNYAVALGFMLALMVII